MIPTKIISTQDLLRILNNRRAAGKPVTGRMLAVQALVEAHHATTAQA